MGVDSRDHLFAPGLSSDWFRVWERRMRSQGPYGRRESELFIDNLLVRIHSVIVMIRWTGLAPWEFEFPFPGSFTSTFRDTCK